MTKLSRLGLELVGLRCPKPEGVCEPDGLSPEIMDRRATTIFELVMLGEMSPLLALQRLVHYGPGCFNALRQNYPEVRPDFAGANLANRELNGFNFAGVSFAGANIGGACFVDCNLRGATWEGAIGKPAFIVNCTLDTGETEGLGRRDLPCMAGFRQALDASLGWDVK